VLWSLLHTISVPSQALYRIKLGTHAHVINYMVIDESSNLIEKAKSGDPEVESLRLDCQQKCATYNIHILGNHHPRRSLSYIGHSSATPSHPVVNSFEAANLVGTMSLAELREELVKLQRKVSQIANKLSH